MAAQAPVPGCLLHHGLGFVYICKTCGDQLLCINCALESHNNHILGTLTDYVTEQKQEIQQYKDFLSKTDIPKVQKDIQQNNQEFEAGSERFQKMIQDIKTRGEQLKREIDDLTNMLVALVTDLQKNNADITEKNKSVLLQFLNKELKPKVDRCQQVLASSTYTNADVISLARELRTTTTVQPCLGTLSRAYFKPGEVSSHLLKRMLGTIVVKGVYQPFQTSHSTIFSVMEILFPYTFCCACPIDDGAWLSKWNEGTFYWVDFKGNVRRKIKSKVKVQSITVSPTTGRVWFCVKDDRLICEIDKNGTIIEQFIVEKKPGSMCFAGHDVIAMGMLGLIQLYTLDGQEKMARGGHLYKREVVTPSSLAYSPQTGDIAAVETDDVSFDDYMAGKKPERQPSVILLDKNLKIKFRCNHIDDMTSQEDGIQQPKFYPWDVCFDHAGDILITEIITKSVMLVDRVTGLFMRTVYTSVASRPRCISLHKDGNLFVGHMDGVMKVINYDG